ncbi:MAG: winged helix-turn-helix domain-containing protein [Myxococcota bacterium]
MGTAQEHIWTFMSNYAHALVCVARDPDATLREIADRVGITERAVHRIVSELEAAGVIRIDRSGRSHHYEIDVSTPLRHPLEEAKTVGDLLFALLTPAEAKALGLRAAARAKRRPK